MSNFVRFWDTAEIKLGTVSDNVKDYFSNSSSTRALSVRIAATHAGKITRNNGFYLPSKMREGAGTFTAQYCKPILEHHESGQDPIGRVTASQYVDLSGELRQSYDSKKIKDAARPEYFNLLDSFVAGQLSFEDTIQFANNYFIQDSTLVQDPDYRGLGYIEILADITDPEAIQKILDGRYLTGSVGAATNAAVCSVCKQDWAGDGKCDHRPGRVYDEVKCVLIAGDLLYDEYSFVNKPADRHSRVIEVNTNGIRDMVEMDDGFSSLVPDVGLEIRDVDLKEITIKTKPSEGHYHTAFLDDDGDGRTSYEEGHAHHVVKFACGEASASDDMTGVLKVKTHSHAIKNPFRKVKDQEDLSMTYKEAYGLASKKLGKTKGLEDAVKKIVDSEQELTEEKLLTLLQDSLPKPSSEPSTPKKPIKTAKDYFGTEYTDLVGDDPWGKEYAQMLFDSMLGNEELAEELKDAKLTAKSRKALASSTFCGPDRSYPVPDCGHAKSAMAYAKKNSAGSRVIACIKRKAARLGCAFEDEAQETQDSVGNFGLEYFDNLLDDELAQMFKGLMDAMKERGLDCGCDSMGDELQEKVDALKKTNRYLSNDIDNLNDALLSATKSLRSAREGYITTLNSLSAEKEDFGDLGAKSGKEIKEILDKLTSSVDIQKIIDSLNSGLSRDPEGTVGDPTLVQDNTKVKDSLIEIDDRMFEQMQIQYRHFLNTRGQEFADKWLEQFKKPAQKSEV